MPWPGARNSEYSENEAGDRWHIVSVGLPLDFRPPSETETGPQLAARAADAGAFVGLAHPAWYGLTLRDAESIEAAHAVEIYNETCLWLNDRPDGWHPSGRPPSEPASPPAPP